MEKNYSLTLDKEFIDYCRLNDIENIEDFAKEVFNQGFAIKKYGWGPPSREELLEEFKKVKERVKTDPVLAKEIVDTAQNAMEGYRKDHESLYDE